MKTFAKRLRYLRNLNNKTQQQLADYLNVSKSTISNYETGYSSPDIETFKKLADFFEVTIDFLLARTDQRTPKDPGLPHEFASPEEAVKFMLEQNVIMDFGGFNIDEMDDDKKVEFANELLNQLRLLSYKYKK